MINALPIVRLEVEEMRYQVVHHLANYHREVEAQVDKTIRDALANFDYEKEIAGMVEPLLREAIQGSVKQAMNEIFWKGEVKDAIHGAVMKALGLRQE